MIPSSQEKKEVVTKCNKKKAVQMRVGFLTVRQERPETLFK